MNVSRSTRSFQVVAVVLVHVPSLKRLHHSGQHDAAVPRIDPPFRGVLVVR